MASSLVVVISYSDIVPVSSKEFLDIQVTLECRVTLNTNVGSYRENHKEFIKNNVLILKSQQRFISEKHNVFTEEDNKITLIANNGKRLQSIHLIETHEYGTRKDLVFRK